MGLFDQFQLLIAEAEKAAPNADANGAGGNPLTNMLPIVIIMVLFYFMILAPQRKQSRQVQDRLSQLKKSDRVITRSGICGSIYSIDKERGRVVLKVDEGSNTKMEFLLSAIEIVESDEKAKPAESTT